MTWRRFPDSWKFAVDWNPVLVAWLAEKRFPDHRPIRSLFVWAFGHRLVWHHWGLQ